METDPKKRWWAYGNYVAGVCPACGRERLMEATDLAGKDRIICEKCNWEPAANEYCRDIDD